MKKINILLKHNFIYLLMVNQICIYLPATTIVSGAIAERVNFYAYCLFSLLNTFVYCIPAGWLWSPRGWLNVQPVPKLLFDQLLKV